MPETVGAERVPDVDVVESRAEATARELRWHPVTRLAFRLTFSYLVVLNFPFPLDVLPGLDKLENAYSAFWHALVPAVGKRLFGVSISIFTNGSGDTTYDYVQVYCFLIVAAAAALVWTVLDRKRPNYAKLYEWLRVYVRFALAAAMVVYGSVKVIQSQFPPPGLDRLVQPFGDASPMGLLWTFMGASKAYNVFAGAGELLGGLLLTMRRTTLFGALVSIAVLSNIVMLNFSYDVPVKLYSLHLMAEAIFLTLPDCRRLMNFFILNRPVAASDLRLPIRSPLRRSFTLALRTIVVIAFVAMWLNRSAASSAQLGDAHRKSPLYGIWDVEQLEVDGVARPPLVTDLTRWRRVIFDYPQTLAIQLMSDTRQRYGLNLDPRGRHLLLKKRDDPAWKAQLDYSRPDRDSLLLDGMIDGRKIHASLHRAPSRTFLLNSRGFHWINEYPFNR